MTVTNKSTDKKTTSANNVTNKTTKKTAKKKIKEMEGGNFKTRLHRSNYVQVMGVAAVSASKLKSDERKKKQSAASKKVVETTAASELVRKSMVGGTMTTGSPLGMMVMRSPLTTNKRQYVSSTTMATSKMMFHGATYVYSLISTTGDSHTCVFIR